MKIIIVPIAFRLVAEVCLETSSTLVRRIDRNIRGAAALTEVLVPGTAGVNEFIDRIRENPSKTHFDNSLSWLTAQQSS
jgi:hypothetical protein